jgi:hypothetical protein
MNPMVFAAKYLIVVPILFVAIEYIGYLAGCVLSPSSTSRA